MPTIFIKDDLRASVEAASGGRVTVLYDDKGYPSFMHVFPRFNVQDIDASLGTGTHEAFVVNGVEKSEIFIGQYLASVRDSRALSLPGMVPDRNLNFDSALTYCKDKGPGWHLMTNAEWAAVALWSWKNGFQPRGNTDYGRAYDLKYESGRRIDKAAPGVTTGYPATLTGSGPVSWRHDNSVSGISDLVGNVWEWVGGLRLQNGEIQVLQNNNAADNTKSQADGSAEWKAVLLSDGSLVEPGTAGTAKYDGATGTSGAPQLDDVLDYPAASCSVSFQGLAADSGITPPGILMRLLLFPHVTTGLIGGMYINNSSERLPLRGGAWNYGSSAGLFALNLSHARSRVYSYIGFRHAFVI